MKKMMLVAFATLFVSACSPEVGSKEWCEDMKDKSRDDWTMQETKDFAKNCLFK